MRQATRRSREHAAAVHGNQLSALSSMIDAHPVQAATVQRKPKRTHTCRPPHSVTGACAAMPSLCVLPTFLPLPASGLAGPSTKTSGLCRLGQRGCRDNSVLPVNNLAILVCCLVIADAAAEIELPGSSWLQQTPLGPSHPGCLAPMRLRCCSTPVAAHPTPAHTRAHLGPGPVLVPGTTDVTAKHLTVGHRACHAGFRTRPWHLHPAVCCGPAA